MYPNYGFGNQAYNAAAQQQQQQQQQQHQQHQPQQQAQQQQQVQHHAQMQQQMQHHQAHGQHQQGGPPGQQQVMYNNQQQYAAMGPPGGNFNTAGNAQMMQGMHPGMMQGQGMSGMGANGQMQGFGQQQFGGAPYGQMMAQPMNPQGFAPNNYMMGPGMQGYPVGQVNLHHPQQQSQTHMLQRMQQAQAQHAQAQAQAQAQAHAQAQHAQAQQQAQMHAQAQAHAQAQMQAQAQAQQAAQMQAQMQHMGGPPHGHHQVNAMMGQGGGTPQRPPSTSQGTPNTGSMNPGMNPVMTPHQGHQQQQQQHQHQQPPLPPQQQQAMFPTPPAPSQVATPMSAQPQTPTFPTGHSGSMSAPAPVAMPSSPASEERDKERFSLLLDINHELLYEAIVLQTTEQEIRKEIEAGGGVNVGEPKWNEEQLVRADYLNCMRRLQANLSYMAAMADRKPEVKLPPCPAFLTPPPLNLTLKVRAAAAGPSETDRAADRAERDQTMKELYRRLRTVFPGCENRKEPAYPPRPPGSGGYKGAQQMSPMAQQQTPTHAGRP